MAPILSRNPLGTEHMLTIRTIRVGSNRRRRAQQLLADNQGENHGV
jgi:hypothetical protein